MKFDSKAGAPTLRGALQTLIIVSLVAGAACWCRLPDRTVDFLQGKGLM